jgi:hypothetical protein
MTTIHHPARVVATEKAREPRPVGRRMRRIGLGVFFVSVAVNAALGIYAVLAPEFGETQGKILGTSLCVTGAALLALACEPAWERRLLGPIPYLGAALGALAFGLTIVGMWVEPESELLGKVTGSIMTVAVACAAASLLALARPAPRHRWVLTVTLGLLALGAALVAIAPWLGDDPSEWYLRALGVVLIALAAFAVSVPVLHWVDRSTLAVTESVTSAVRYCPYCGSSVAGEAGAALACSRCGRGFTVVAAGAPSSNLT